jgi:TrpR-related protein YerC/YecD
MNKALISANTNSLLKAILVLKTTDQARRFFADLLTIDELDEFGKRWRAAQLLAAGVSYEAITAKTNLSSTTIARVSRCLTGPQGGYRLVLEKEHHPHQRSRP